MLYTLCMCALVASAAALQPGMLPARTLQCATPLQQSRSVLVMAAKKKAGGKEVQARAPDSTAAARPPLGRRR